MCFWDAQWRTMSTHHEVRWSSLKCDDLHWSVMFYSLKSVMFTKAMTRQWQIQGEGSWGWNPPFILDDQGIWMGKYSWNPPFILGWEPTPVILSLHIFFWSLSSFFSISFFFSLIPFSMFLFLAFLPSLCFSHPFFLPFYPSVFFFFVYSLFCNPQSDLHLYSKSSMHFIAL